MSRDLREIDFATLADMDDGKLNLVLRHHVKRASEDCQDRPADNKPREVIVKLTFVPIMEDDGDAYDAGMQVCVSSKVPTHKSKAYSVGMRRNGTFVCNLNSLGNVNQNTIDFDGDDE